MNNSFKFFKLLIFLLCYICLINKNIFWKKNKINLLSYNKKYLFGRNRFGSLILYIRFKKNMNRIKIVDNYFMNYGVLGIYCRFEYDFNRFCFILLI